MRSSRDADRDIACVRACCTVVVRLAGRQGSSCSMWTRASGRAAEEQKRDGGADGSRWTAGAGGCPIWHVRERCLDGVHFAGGGDGFGPLAQATDLADWIGRRGSPEGAERRSGREAEAEAEAGEGAKEAAASRSRSSRRDQTGRRVSGFGIKWPIGTEGPSRGGAVCRGAGRGY